MRNFLIFITTCVVLFSSCSKSSIGDCIEGNCEDGYGAMRWNNHTYKGDWKDGKMNGYGETIWDDGGYEKGQYVEDKLNGYAEQLHGSTSEFAGDTYKGDWKDNKPHGNGEYFFYEAKRTYKGESKEGKSDGYGVLTYHEGSDHPNRSYEGNWKAHARNGFGKESFGTDGEYKGDTYEGHWKDDLFHGLGTYYWSDGSKYEGSFRNGVQNGRGTYWFSDGTKFEGIWRQGYCEELANLRKQKGS